MLLNSVQKEVEELEQSMDKKVGTEVSSIGPENVPTETKERIRSVDDY